MKQLKKNLRTPKAGFFANKNKTSIFKIFQLFDLAKPKLFLLILILNQQSYWVKEYIVINLIYSENIFCKRIIIFRSSSSISFRSYQPLTTRLRHIMLQSLLADRNDLHYHKHVHQFRVETEPSHIHLRLW